MILTWELIHEHTHDVRRKIYFDRNDTLKRDCVALGKAVVECRK